MKIAKKRRLIEFSLVLGILLMVNFISAVAVSGYYTVDRPLEIYPGQSKMETLILQNMAGDSDVKYKANLSEGSEIASITDSSDEYLVPIGSNDVPVTLEISVPEGTAIGTEYTVKVEFTPIPLNSNDTGMIQIESGLTKYFSVKVVEEPPEPEPAAQPVEETGGSAIIVWIIIIIAIVVIAVVVFIIIKKKKDSSTMSTTMPATMPAKGTGNL